MKLKDLLEMESHDYDLMKKEEGDAAFEQRVKDLNDGKEISIIDINDEDGKEYKGIIHFDNKMNISLEVSPRNTGVEKAATKELNAAYDELFDGEEELPDEIEIEL